MKVRKMLNMLLYKTSTLYHVLVARGGDVIELTDDVVADPMAICASYDVWLNATVVFFRIVNEDLIIYVR